MLLPRYSGCILCTVGHHRMSGFMTRKGKEHRGTLPTGKPNRHRLYAGLLAQPMQYPKDLLKLTGAKLRQAKSDYIAAYNNYTMKVLTERYSKGNK